LRALLDSLPGLAREPGALRELLAGQGMPEELVSASAAILEDLGITDALAHCARQASSDAGFIRHFHGWFDAFRSLKFIHALRDAGWPMRSLAELEGCTPRLWPAAATDTRDPDELLAAIRAHWSWRT
jgi:recombinational DNA repair protein (RecF pathway)